MARILVGALYNNAKNGGSGSFIGCLINAFMELGHDVVYSNSPRGLNQKDFDFSITSHRSILRQISNWDIPKIHIMQGIVPHEEHYESGASQYVSISEEVKSFMKQTYKIDSTVIRQPIDIPTYYKKSLSNKTLFIKNSATREIPWVIPNMKLSNKDIPITPQIQNSKMCITLGRGALEAMAQGKSVIIADNRFYQGLIGDGYITPDNFERIEKHNFSGRAFRHTADNNWMIEEFKKYNPKDGQLLYEIVKEKNDKIKIAQRLMDLI